MVGRKPGQHCIRKPRGSKLGINLTFDEVSYREMDSALSEVLAARGTA
jgi:hypothetical protein